MIINVNVIFVIIYVARLTWALSVPVLNTSALFSPEESKGCIKDSENIVWLTELRGRRIQ